MKTLHLVKFVIACFFTSCLFLSSCTKDATYEYQYQPGNPNTTPTFINMYLTAAASSAAYSKVNIDIQGFDYKDSYDASEVVGWERGNVDRPGQVDLLTLLNGKTMQLNMGVLPGDLKQLRLHIGDHSSVEVNGVKHMLSIPQEIKENGFVIFPNIPQSTMYMNSVMLHFDATHSIIFDDITQEYSLKPVVFSFDETTTGSIEGYINPVDANATIHIEADANSRSAMNNTNTMADASNHGYFKLVGVPAGIYNLEMRAGDGSNRTKTLTAVEVKIGETVNVGSSDLE